MSLPQPAHTASADPPSAEAIRERLASALVDRVVGCAAGSEPGTDGEYCVYERPANTYFIGSILPIPEPARTLDELTDDLRSEFHSKLAPYAIGAEVAVASPEAVVDISAEVSVYYRIIPRREWQQNVESADRLIPAFRRIRAVSEPITVTVAQLFEDRDTVYGHDSPLGAALDHARRQALADPDAVRGLCEDVVSPTTPDSFDKAIASALSGEFDPPAWAADLRVRTRPWKGDERIISVLLVNTSPDERGAADARDDHGLFDVRLRLSVRQGTFRPFIFVELPDSYRFDRRMWGLGLNCTTEPEDGVHPTAAPTAIVTRSAPRAIQPRTVGRTSVGKRELPELSYARLAQDPAPVLRDLESAMTEYADAWQRDPDRFLPPQDTVQRRHRDRDDCRRGAEHFLREIEAFRRGVDLLQQGSKEALRAFRLTNEAFARHGKHTGWHPFQAVFIVSQLPSLVAMSKGEPDASEDVQVLWFPTGGGKTEAYLGLTIAAMFLDRLRGKNSGTTALFRFPLRLLTLQQFQRVAAVCAAAELVRQDARLPGDPFSVGFWVGGDNTPNDVDANRARELAADSSLRKSYRKIHDCPFCGRRGAIAVVWDSAAWSLAHRCSNDACRSRQLPGGHLPLKIVDREIYREPPTVIISTVDKLAVMAAQIRFANVFGEVKFRCPRHGYSWRNECDVEGCHDRLARVGDGERKLLPPTLEVQDELHLIKEDLGAFDSHYETFMVHYMRTGPGGVPWKTIASTATVRDFERHVEHLYARRGTPSRFPVPGPTWRESFYALQDEGTGRIFVGVMPHNKTHINATVELLWYIQREVQRLRRMEPKTFAAHLNIDGAVGREQQDLALDDYEISLTYVLTKRSGDQVAESLGSQVNSYLRRDDWEPVANETLTGGTRADRITAVMEEVERRYRGKEPKDRIRSLVATSMISHGVDVDRFNVMLFFGMPRQTAEYVQASSRVGRRMPGISFICFAPSRERDRSHFHYFAKYHEYLERLVEPPAINRWSRFSLAKTLPGLLSGLLLNRYSRYLDKSLYRTQAVRSAERQLPAKDITAFIKAAYRTDMKGGEYFGTEVGRQTNGLLERLLDHPTSSDVHKALDAMQSLRDTEDPLPFLPERTIAGALERLGEGAEHE